MAFHLIEDVPEVRLAHHVNTSVFRFATSTIITYRYKLYPISIRRPAEGRLRREVYCGTCQQTVEVIVPSRQLALWRQRLLLAAVFVLMAALIALIGYLISRDFHSVSGALGAVLIILLLVVVGGMSLLVGLLKAREAHGVRVALRQPSKAPRRHSIRRPPPPPRVGARVRHQRRRNEKRYAARRGAR